MVVRDYKGARFIGYIVPPHSTAICQEQIDSGLCKLNFRDERYLPMEGAGAEGSIT